MASFDPLSFSTLIDSAGAIAASAKLNYYETGSTTPKAVYSDAGLTAPITQPVRASTLGVLPVVYFSAGRYKRAVTTSADVTIAAYAADPIDASVEMVTAAAAPSPTYPFLRWYDTVGGHVWERNHTDTGWTDLGTVDSLLNAATVTQQLAGTSAAVSSTPASVAGLWLHGTDIATGASLSLPATGGGYFDLTGTVTVQGISSATGGRRVAVKFAGIGTLTHNAASFILPSGYNEKTNAGDVYEFVNIAASGASGSNWRCVGKNLTSLRQAYAKTGNYTLTDADRDSVIRFSGLSADATLSLPLSANRSGFRFTVVNEDTGGFGVIIDPNGAETLDGFTTRKTYVGSRVTIQADVDGTGWRTCEGKYRFFSGNQTISAAGLLTLPHTLGVRPNHVWVELQCTTAELNYTINDIMPFEFTNSDGVTVMNISCVPDATNLVIRLPSTATWQVANKTTGAGAAITAANWRVRFYAEE